MNTIFQRIPAMGSVFASAPMLGEVQISGNNRAVNASSEPRESAPNLNCNVEWDPGCPRPKPQSTMVPYIPSSYLRGSDHAVQVGSVEYHPPLVLRRKK